jgi:acyl dehydratase
MSAMQLQSFIAGRWVGNHPAQELRSAIDGQVIARTHDEAIDFGEAHEHARCAGVGTLLALDFQQRAQRLKKLAAHLGEHKEELYAISRHTGATRNDSWIDIEGGTGTLHAYAGMGSNELPSGNVVHEGPAVPLGKKNLFAGTHILVPRRGVAVHVNAFNFPVWGMLEKFAPSFLAGMPCIVKPATATSYLTEACVRLMHASGVLPPITSCSAPESTGHGSPLPMLKHGGPGRAGGGEELGGIRAVKHYLQRAAVQGSPTILAAITREHVRGAKVSEGDVHPFKKSFEDIAIGYSLLTHRRTVSEADIVNFGGISGDYFYMHFDELAARDTAFGKRIAHGYFVLSAAAGLFVHPGVGPVLANYGLDTLRFVKPVAIGDTIRARLTCKRKTDRQKKDDKGVGQGVVAWDVEVRNQNDELVASYDILTLVAKKG